MKALIPGIPVIVFLMISCTWAPDGDNLFFNDIAKAPPAGTVLLTDYDSEDTIRVYGPVSFSYKIEGFKSEGFTGSDVFLGKTFLYHGQAYGTFNILQSQLTEGVFDLTIKFTSNSGGSSLAASANMESGEVFRKWVVVVEMPVPPKPEIKFSIENGYLTVNWTKYNKANFDYYHLVYKSNSYIEDRISDPNQTTLVDKNFVGGYNPSAQVTIYTKSGWVVGDEVFFQDSGFNMQVTVNPSDSMATMKWNKCKYPGAFKSYKVFEGLEQRATVSNIGDTTFTIKTSSIFGEYSHFAVQLHGAEKYVEQTYSEKDLIYDFKNLGPSKGWYYSIALNTIFSYDRSTAWFRRYDSQFKVVDSVQFFHGIVFPYPGDKVYAPTSGAIQQYDLATRQSNFIQVKTSNYANVVPVSISAGANLLSYLVIDQSDRFDQRIETGIFDLTAGTRPVYSFALYPEYSGIRNIIVSDDGVWGYNQNAQHISKWNGTFFDFQFYVNTAGPFWRFRPDKPEEIIFNTPETKIIGPGYTRFITPPTQSALLQYDWRTKRLQYQTGDNRQHLIDIDNGHVKTVKATPGCWLVGGYLITQSGIAKKVL